MAEQGEQNLEKEKLLKEFRAEVEEYKKGEAIEGKQAHLQDKDFKTEDLIGEDEAMWEIWKKTKPIWLDFKAGKITAEELVGFPGMIKKEEFDNYRATVFSKDDSGKITTAKLLSGVPESRAHFATFLANKFSGIFFQESGLKGE